jgi:tRNA threonylcarbamoyl adenosine modification protein YeaZ
MYLGIDTSAPISFVAVGDLAESFQATRLNDGSPESRGSESIHLLAREVLKTSNKTWRDIQGIYIGEGPGSFTGLRIGFGFAQGVALALKIPCQQISSFKAWSKEFWGQGKCSVVIADAQRGEYFCQIFSPVGDTLSEVRIVPGAELVSYAQGVGGENLHWIGFCDTAGIGISPERPKRVASSMIELGVGLPKQPFSPLKLSELSPNYIREVSARTLADRGKKIIP